MDLGLCQNIVVHTDSDLQSFYIRYCILQEQLLHCHYIFSHGSRHLTNLASYQLGFCPRGKPTCKFHTYFTVRNPFKLWKRIVSCTRLHPYPQQLLPRHISLLLQRAAPVKPISALSSSNSSCQVRRQLQASQSRMMFTPSNILCRLWAIACSAASCYCCCSGLVCRLGWDVLLHEQQHAAETGLA